MHREVLPSKEGNSHRAHPGKDSLGSVAAPFPPLSFCVWRVLIFPEGKYEMPKDILMSFQLVFIKARWKGVLGLLCSQLAMSTAFFSDSTASHMISLPCVWMLAESFSIFFIRGVLRLFLSNRCGNGFQSPL